MDEKFLEQAGELADRINSGGVRECSKNALPDEDLEPIDYITHECKECGDDLPEFRMKKAQVFCVPCQTAKERARKR